MPHRLRTRARAAGWAGREAELSQCLRSSCRLLSAAAGVGGLCFAYLRAALSESWKFSLEDEMEVENFQEP